MNDDKKTSHFCLLLGDCLATWWHSWRFLCYLLQKKLQWPEMYLCASFGCRTHRMVLTTPHCKKFTSFNEDFQVCSFPAASSHCFFASLASTSWSGRWEFCSHSFLWEVVGRLQVSLTWNTGKTKLQQNKLNHNLRQTRTQQSQWNTSQT